MPATLATNNGDRRLILANAEALRQPSYMAYSAVAATADAGTDVITSNAHGLINGNAVLILGTAPGGLTAGHYYFVRDVTTNTFKLAAQNTPSAAIDLTSAGGPFSWVKQTWWNLRIGLRGSIIDAGAGNIVAPQLALGACKGNANGFGSVQTEHAIGWRFGVDWTYNAGPTAYYSGLMTVANHMVKKVGAAITTTAGNNGSAFFSADPAIRNGIFTQIVKTQVDSGGASGAGSWKIWTFVPTTSAAAQSDLTDSEYLAIMELTDLTQIATVKAGYGGLIATNVTLAVNENTNGVLDHLFVFWNKSTQKFSFDIKHRTVV